jgi:hypothetical protein
LITDDFNRHLHFTEGTSCEINNIFLEINDIPNIALRDVVLFFDAINESPNAKRLLRQIDKLVQELGILEWPKVVVTCRPETWRAIKRGLNLATHSYYRLEGQEGIPIELKRFSREETAGAYRKYKRIYDLKTDWEDIPMEMRETLQHPLYMWLISETNVGKSLPLSVRQGQVFDDYIQALRDTGRLEGADLEFLRHDIMPLMISEARCDNSISGDVLAFSQSHDGRPMSELIQNDERLNTGRLVNQSFVNLCNAGILTKRELVGSYEIGFQYEGFYDYFGSRRLIELRNQLPTEEVAGWYLDIAKLLPDSTFLWGSLRRVVLLECQKGNYAPALTLASTDNRLSRDLIVSVLKEVGRYDVEGVSTFIQEVLSNAIPRMRELKGPREVWAKTVAVIAAGHLAIDDAILLALGSRNESVRSIAVRETRQIWEKDPERGLSILRCLQNNMPAFFRPVRYVVLQSLFDVSIAILFQQSHNQKVVNELQVMWQQIISQVLFINNEKPRGLRNRLIVPLIRLSIIAIKRLGAYAEADWGPPTSLREIEEFCCQNDDVKKHMKQMIPYLDPAYGTLQDIRGDLIAAACGRDVLSTYVALIILTSRASMGDLQALDTLLSMTEEAVQINPPSPFAPQGIAVLTRVYYQQGFDSDQMLERIRSILQVYLLSGKGQYKTSIKTYTWLPVSHYLAVHYQRWNDLDEELVDLTSEMIRQTTDEDVLSNFAHSIAVISYSYNYDLPAASTAWLRRLAIGEHENMRKVMEEGLARVYAVAPEDVEDLMEDLALPQSIRQQVRAQSTVTMRECIVAGAAWTLDKLMNPQGLFSAYFAWALEQALVCEKFDTWLTLVARSLINSLYERRIFNTTQPALSKATDGDAV